MEAHAISSWQIVKLRAGGRLAVMKTTLVLALAGSATAFAPRSVARPSVAVNGCASSVRHYFEQLHRKSLPRRAARGRRAPRGAAGSLRSAEKSISGWLSRAAGGRAARSCTRYSQNK